MTTCKAIGKMFKTPCGIKPLAGTELCWIHTEGYKTPLQKCQEENEKLKKFARTFIETECWGYGPEIDGGEVQEWAERCGLIESYPATKQDVIDFAEYDIEIGDKVFKFTEVLKEKK